ncbi:ABC transporter ATP-binding protein [Thermotalea metallivorans]|uniref:Putative siderophore transport system ATP-binding protein YusV n=1 Tax=Thermotalea metallivorans TaxID=520762 RepID=A0A140L6I4_9FIRM|nr:ABC transporter ATP-binding protein [Thermotalea metallivorans]KXG76159.1 putative siderophore transport system ATP-binding protein YusV [Thermotalea metallivorans]
MSILQTKNLTLTYGDTIIIKDLHLTIPKEKITVLIGSNGCGKSTLLRSLARLLKPKEGAVILNGKELTKWPTKEIAKNLAILPQGPIAPEGLTVLQLVKQGRYPHQNWLQQWSKRDEAIVHKALEVTQMKPFADRPLDALSGGQRQRAWIAMVLAQETDTIILDEPTTYLDMTYQIDILDLLFDLNRNEKRTIIMVLHDLNLACRYADHIIAVHNQSIYAQGAPEDIVTEEMVRTVFNMECQIARDPLFGTPMCIPYGKGRIIKKSDKRAG